MSIQNPHPVFAGAFGRLAAAVRAGSTNTTIDARVEHRYGYTTLDCRDGVHGACAGCDCSCHNGANRPDNEAA